MNPEDWAARQIRNARNRLAKLRDERPDLAELVATEAMSLDETVDEAD